MRLTTIPVKLEEANAFVARHHRHHPPVVGHKFSIGAVLGDEVVGVVIVGRPTSRMRDDGMTLEVTRLCTDGTPNACSFLYGAAAKACFALGYKRIGTYTMASESGASLRASGWKLYGTTRGGSWNTPSRPRVDKHELGVRFIWEKAQ
jgi:hypothetical protein